MSGCRSCSGSLKSANDLLEMLTELTVEVCRCARELLPGLQCGDTNSVLIINKEICARSLFSVETSAIESKF